MFVYDLVGSPGDSFSYDAAQVITAHAIRIILFPWPQAYNFFSSYPHLSAIFIMLINASIFIIVVILITYEKDK